MKGNFSKRGLASADQKIRERVGRAGGQAKHFKRGLQAADMETKTRVARAGGIARGKQRREEAAKRIALEKAEEEGFQKGKEDNSKSRGSFESEGFLEC